MSTHSEITVLKELQQALDVGYAEGSKQRAHGTHHELMDDSRDLYEMPYRFQRRLSPYYKPWRRGFDAGYIGQDKPKLAQ
jgi:hypothetical protein